MSKTDELLKMMTLDASDIEAQFEQIAQMLFESFAIQKGKTKYLFKEIEFYFYSNNHRDIITYPRISKPLCFYKNEFGGIDLNFDSRIGIVDNADKRKKTKKYILDDNACFGGILIRQLIRISEEGRDVIRGPLACADELFKREEATGMDMEPCLVEQDNGMVGMISDARINLLSREQKVEDKVNSILGKYLEHPEKEVLYNAFAEYKDKPYRYIRCETLMHDEETDEVYFSPWLEDPDEGDPKFCQRLIKLLKRLKIEPKTLKATNDYWVRDFMPIQLGKNEFFKYHYYPDYLVNKNGIKTITDASKVLRGMGINCRSTELIIDGGNMVACGPYIVMTDKVFTENRRRKGDPHFKALLESELRHPVIVIPWTMHGNPKAKDTDKYGHADGFIRWCGENRILMGNHGDEYPEEAKAIREILESYGFEVTEMRFKNKVTTLHADLNWAYINFLQVGKNIIVPIFKIEEDEIAKQCIKKAFRDCNIEPIEMSRKIVGYGGALHCISWNISASPNEA
jgi:agmatine/peptidylarginine deiminase